VFWRNGSHVASLNWQVYDRGMQVNEAMFVGSPGWVEKPLHMRKGSEYTPKGGREKLIGEVVGISSCTSNFFFFSLSYLTFDVTLL
jgi:phosphatidylinositol phospholipase C delta